MIDSGWHHRRMQTSTFVPGFTSFWGHVISTRQGHRRGCSGRSSDYHQIICSSFKHLVHSYWILSSSYELRLRPSIQSTPLTMLSLSRLTRLGLSSRRIPAGTSLRSYASTTSTFPPLPSHPPKPPASTTTPDQTSQPDKSSEAEPEPIPARLLGSREEIERKKELAKERYREALEKRMKE